MRAFIFVLNTFLATILPLLRLVSVPFLDFIWQRESLPQIRRKVAEKIKRFYGKNILVRAKILIHMATR